MPANTPLAIIFNRLLQVNGTYTSDSDINNIREAAMTIEKWS